VSDAGWDVTRVADAPPGFRLPPSAYVGQVTLQVASLERSLGFYRDVLGLQVISRDRDDGQEQAVVGVAEDATGLVTLRERPGVRPVRPHGRLGLYHVAYLLPDRAALGRFLRHVVDVGVPLGAADHAVSEALYLTDPDGLGVEVYRDRPRSEWIVRNGQVVGGADPIDSTGILDAAGDSAWTGAPAGTRVGHVHFHVGALDEAVRFYHAALGLDRVRWAFPGALFLSAGGYHHHVGLNTWAAGAPVAGAQDARLLEWTLVVPSPGEVVAAAASLRASGVAVATDDASVSMTAPDPWDITVRVTTRS
jgi:catechol 2,3-dioxygenase